MRFSEFMKESNFVDEFCLVIETCLSKGMSVEHFEKIAIKPVVERMDFISEQDFLNKIKRKVSVFFEAGQQAPPSAIHILPEDQPAGIEKQQQFQQAMEKKYATNIDNFERAARGEIKTALENLRKTLYDQTLKNQQMGPDYKKISNYVTSNMIDKVINALRNLKSNKINFVNKQIAPQRFDKAQQAYNAKFSQYNQQQQAKPKT